MGALSLACLTTFPGVRRWFYQWFVLVHTTASAFGVFGLWQHLALQHSDAQVYSLVGIALWASFIVFSLGLDILRHVRLGRKPQFPKAVITKIYHTRKGERVVMNDACHIEVRTWMIEDIRPGEFLQISLPGLRLLSFFESHPFWIVWWERDHETGLLHLDLLVKQRQGFTRRLLSHRDQECTAWLSGPFGHSMKFEDFGTVLMLATDIGIAAHLPYIKMLMEARQRAAVRTRRVVVVWQVKNSSE